MKKINFYFFITLSILLTSCTSDDGFHSTSSPSEISSSGNGQNNQSGLVTAGEWNDLENWNFWNELLNREEYADFQNYWNFHTNNRISIKLYNGGQPQIDVPIILKQGENIVWESKTDNKGQAEIWVDLNTPNHSIEMREYTLVINEQAIDVDLKLYEQGVNEIDIKNVIDSNNNVELSFIIDATSSMSDELEFLKNDLINVIERVKNDNPSIQISTSSVFYRDEGDEYLVKKSDFTNNLNTTINFIQEQRANGGGDYPEALHKALQIGVEELQWSNVCKSRIAFLLLDAPPHYDTQILEDIHVSIREAARKGIKVIPISASGIDKNTEFLMRFFSISTNGTYVFITDDSGIGNDHIEPSVGEYQVEYLNDLLVRLINKYTE